MAVVPPTEDPAKSGIRKPAAAGSGTHAVGEERPSARATSAAHGGATSSLVGVTGLKSAVDELYKEHPHGYDQHGPHHGTSDHVRHMPLGGLRPTKGSY